MARALAWHARGQRFESVILHTVGFDRQFNAFLFLRRSLTYCDRQASACPRSFEDHSIRTCGAGVENVKRQKVRAAPSAFDATGPAKQKVSKGAWWMPWLTEAMKDVISCDKPRVGANNP